MSTTAERDVKRTAKPGRGGHTPAAPRPGRRRLRDNLTGWGFVAPAMLIVLGLSIFPAIWAFFLSLQKWDGFSEPEQWLPASAWDDPTFRPFVPHAYQICLSHKDLAVLPAEAADMSGMVIQSIRSKCATLGPAVPDGVPSGRGT